MPRGGSYVLWGIETAKGGAREDDGHDGGGVRGTQRARRRSGLARGFTREKVVFWYRVCPSRSPRRSTSCPTTYSPRGTPGAPEHACARRPHGATPEGPKPRGDGRVSLKRGTRQAKNKGKRVRAAKNAAPDALKTQVKQRGESGGFRHECRRLRALLIGQCGAR